MAPVSNSVVGIDDDQRFALMKFRRSVRDVMKPEHDDHFLLRWLRARQWDPEAAEKMLRDSMAWRDKWGLDTSLHTWQAPEVLEKHFPSGSPGFDKEGSPDLYLNRSSMAWRDKWGLDTSLHTWQAPEVLEKHFPSGSPGFDKEGSPVIVVPFVGLDAWGLLHTISKTDIIRMILRHLENYLAIAKKQAETRGPAALKLTVIFDLDGFQMRQYAWKPAAEMVFSLLQIYEANYPEILKTCLIINAPKVFSLAFSVIKKFMHEYTISKISIHGSDKKKWRPHLLNFIDKEQLPVYYGGNMVDENGDPKCSSIIKPGGKVPKSYYSCNSTSSHDREYKRVSLKPGDKHTVDLLCADSDSVLRWEVGVDNHDIKFLIVRRDEDGKETVEHGPRKVPEGPVDIGVLPVTGPSTYTVIFDNSNSYLKNKKIFYDVIIALPARDLKMIDMPEDSTALSAEAAKTE